VLRNRGKGEENTKKKEQETVSLLGGSYTARLLTRKMIIWREGAIAKLGEQSKGRDESVTIGDPQEKIVKPTLKVDNRGKRKDWGGRGCSKSSPSTKKKKTGKCRST